MGRKLEVISTLKAWAVAGGAEAQALTNEYELLRLRLNGGVAIVYRNKHHVQTWNPLAIRLRQAMEKSEPFPADLQIVRKVKNKQTLTVTQKTIIERDGPGCFYCGDDKEGEMTTEHLVPRAHGGPNHLSNKFRACAPCNGDAGHMSAPEKIRLREERHPKFNHNHKAR